MDPHRTLADFCQWWPEGQRRPCSAPAGLVLVRPSGRTVGFSWATHAPARASQIHGRYLVLERGDWEARGAGYRGVDLAA